MKQISQHNKLKNYNKLYNESYVSLCVFSNKYVNDIEHSKDIVQEIFIKLWNNKINFENIIAAKSYLYTSVKNKSLDYLKSKEYKIKNKSINLDLDILDTDTYFEKELLIEEVIRGVELALKKLPKKCRKVVELSMMGYQNNQISEELTISINTVKTQKKIAYQKLRLLLNKKHLYIFFILTSQKMSHSSFFDLLK